MVGLKCTQDSEQCCSILQAPGRSVMAAQLPYRASSCPETMTSLARPAGMEWGGVPYGHIPALFHLWPIHRALVQVHSLVLHRTMFRILGPFQPHQNKNSHKTFSEYFSSKWI